MKQTVLNKCVCWERSLVLLGWGGKLLLHTPKYTHSHIHGAQFLPKTVPACHSAGILMERLLDHIPAICHDDLRRIAAISCTKNIKECMFAAASVFLFTCPLLPSAENNTEHFSSQCFSALILKTLPCFYSIRPPAFSEF